MSDEPVFKKKGRDGKTYLTQAQGDGFVSIEIDESDPELEKLVDKAIKEKPYKGDLGEIVKYKRDKKKKE
jgi:hypothetical protein